MKDADRLRAKLAGRAGGDWELYRKSGDSRELIEEASRRSTASRREEGWAARWWEAGSERFACGSSPAALEQAIEAAGRISASASTAPRWPTAKTEGEAPASPLDPPPELFENLNRQVSTESRGEARLAQWTVRRGRTVEWIENGSGLSVSQSFEWLDGIASAIARRGGRSCEARVVSRWDGPPDPAELARRLADRATLALSDRATPVERGEWLLDPSVAAALLAAVAPLFSSERPPRWLSRAQFASPHLTVIDDATADAPFDGEGTSTRRVLLVESGEQTHRLRDLRSAARGGASSTGHGVRPSYRTPPEIHPRRLFVETKEGVAARDLLASVKRGLYASALTAPARFDLEQDRFDVEFTGVAVIAGRGAAPVAGARARGRVSQLLRRIKALGTDLQFFPLPHLVGAPTLLVERADFD